MATLRAVERAFSDAMSYAPIHNHIVQAYHQAGKLSELPARRYMWHLHPMFVPDEVRDTIDAQPVLADVKAKLTLARTAIESIRKGLDREIVTTVANSPDYPYRNLHPSVKVIRFVPENAAPAWSYTFNPYQLAMIILDDYEFFIDRIARPRPLQFSKLSYTHEEARRQKNNTHLVENELYRIHYA